MGISRFCGGNIYIAFLIVAQKHNRRLWVLDRTASSMFGLSKRKKKKNGPKVHFEQRWPLIRGILNVNNEGKINLGPANKVLNKV